MTALTISGLLSIIFKLLLWLAILVIGAAGAMVGLCVVLLFIGLFLALLGAMVG